MLLTKRCYGFTDIADKSTSDKRVLLIIDKIEHYYEKSWKNFYVIITVLEFLSYSLSVN